MSEPQAGDNADAVDLAGIGDGVLECTVDTPLKENDGSKDTYVSYLISTHVGCLFLCDKKRTDSIDTDRLQILPENVFHRTSKIHRFRLPSPDTPP